MANLGSWPINSYLPIPATCHRFSTGAAYAPTAITYSIYEDATAVGLDEDIDMVPASPFDGIVGLYYARRQLTTAAGFEVGKNYLVVVKATVDSIAAIQTHTFEVVAEYASTFKKNTAFNYYKFVMFLSSDHRTPATGKTLTCERAIDDGTFAACANAAAEIGATGVYKINFAASDLNGDSVMFRFSEAACDTWHFEVFPQAV